MVAARLIVVIVLCFTPISYLTRIWDFISPYDIYGIPLWMFIVFALYLFLVPKKRKSSGVSPTGVAVAGIVAHKYLKKPSVYSEDPNIEIISVNPKLTEWEVAYRYINKERIGIQKQKFSGNATSLSTGKFKINWP